MPNTLGAFRRQRTKLIHLLTAGIRSRPMPIINPSALTVKSVLSPSSLLSTGVLLLGSLLSLAQPSSRSNTPNDTLVSPKLLTDGRVQFNIYAPKATDVTLTGDFPGGRPARKLRKSDMGVWSVSLDSISSNVYSYDLTVDGVKTFDPKNPRYREAQDGLSNVFTVPGKAVEFMAMKNVPHGRVELVWYPSPALNLTRRMHVYLPPGYEAVKEKLPVLYLLHGGGGNDASWTTMGQANFILDNLLAEGKMKPMVVVMPAGNVPGSTSTMGAGPDGDLFTKDFLQGIIPYVDAHYTVSKQRESRAIAGLSMGGIGGVQTLNIALWHPQLFSYVVPLSTGYFPPVLAEVESKYSQVLKNPAIKAWKLLWIGMGGATDIAYQNNKNTMALFDKNGIKYQYTEVPGGHTYTAWRENLRQFAPLLFR